MSRAHKFTEWGRSTDLVDSAYGKIPYRWWCEEEAERINSAGGQAMVMARQIPGKITEVCVCLNGRTVDGVIIPRRRR